MFLCYAKCIWSIPRANSAITLDSHSATELSGPRFQPPKGCADLQMSCCAFPRDVGALRGKATLTFLRTAVNFLFLLGFVWLPCLSPWLGHIHSKTSLSLSQCLLRLESPQGWEQPGEHTGLPLSSACCFPFQGCCLSLMGSL